MKKSQNSADSTQQYSEQGLRSYITVLTEGGGGVTTAVRGAEDRLDTDTPAGRRDDTSLQGMATTAAATREVEEGVAMGVMLPRLIDAVSAFNLAFLTVTEAAAAP
ncbi:uncharacterized protein BDCG_06429 [Blastomyces dermatitidis ER-3]|uniref:Uncharacterized protein n=1 Tax=Ajellomyces dermatitidis (strain ER-3 / ATCC MYA-2586) TaxID=559297 RepID=A0ABP2F4S1_AJEDR|nr:uncharacterized protein BDCG_06429 [Blastomyces dermatitidis ER-3]EEQ91309.1 hypothetical protein BDCG_06429 [Blastomyces dermatitidis ER-3]